MLSDLFIIRHAQPAQQSGIPYHTPPGPDLNDRGRDEARQAALFLADKTVEHLFVSPFARTTQTAELLIEQLGVQATFTRLLQEHAPGETSAQVRARIREFLASVDDTPLTRIALVTHGSPIRELLLELSGERIDLTRHVYAGGNPAPTAGIWRAAHSGESWRIELVFKPTL